MATVATLINRTVRQFRLQESPDVLVSTIGVSDQTITFNGFLSPWGPGDVVEIGSEYLLVTSADNDAKTANVVRGWFNTTPAAHNADAPIFKNPRVQRVDIFDLINDCLNDLFPEVYAIGSDGFSAGATYEQALAAEVYEVLSISAEKGARDLWVPIRDAYVRAGLPDRSLIIRVSLPTGTPIRYLYSKTFTKATDEADDLNTDLGLEDYMFDLPYYYAMSRLMATQEVPRTQSQTAQNHQRSADIPPFLALRTGDWYWVRYQDMKKQAQKTLVKKYPSEIKAGYGR